MTIASGSKQILIHGTAFILVGLLWGLVVPHTPYPRLALTAHVEFEENGVLFIVLAILLLSLPHRVGRKSVWVMLLSVWLTWLLILSEVANAWWGTTQILPIAAHQAGASGAAPWQELIVTLAHIVGGLVLIVAWILLMVGFIRPSSAADARP
jgi:hydroxylaminobenzene mutase